MKKVWKGIGAVVLAVIIFAGGYTTGQRVRVDSILSALPHKTLDTHEADIPEPTAAVTDKPSAGVGEALQPEKNIIEKNLVTAVQDGWTLVNKAPVLPDDNGSGSLYLYTSAEKDRDGNWLFDDSNNWVLEVRSRDGEYYTLLNKRIQLGSVNFVSGDDENGNSVITVITTTTAGIIVDKYTYNGTAFEGQTVYNSGALNICGSSF